MQKPQWRNTTLFINFCNWLYLSMISESADSFIVRTQMRKNRGSALNVDTREAIV